MKQRREVPAHEIVVLAPRTARYCVAVFVINEGERLHRQLARMQPYLPGLDLVIADGGSTDGSVDHARLRATGVRCLLVNRGPRGLGSQMRMAFDWTLNEGYEGIIVMDGNDKDDPEALPRFAAALDAGADHVQGSRFIAGGRSENLPFARWLGVRFIHAPLITLAARRRYTDTTNGFRAYSRRLLLDDYIAVFRDELRGYELHYYLAIRAARAGLRVVEIPVTRAYPKSGAVPSKIAGWRGNLRVLKTLFRTITGAYNP